MTAILGKKLGMTQLFSSDGRLVPVTVIEAGPCCVVQVKTVERDGYPAVQVGFIEETKIKKQTKPRAGVFKKAGVKVYRILKEFSIDGPKAGDFIRVDSFSKGDVVQVAGVSKGKGFQGVMKRHRFKGGPDTHGSMFNRAPGSIGASSFPSRVWRGQRMAGHMGNRRVTVRNLEVFDVKPEQNIMLIKGAIPGAPETIIEIWKE